MTKWQTEGMGTPFNAPRMPASSASFCCGLLTEATVARQYDAAPAA